MPRDEFSAQQLAELANARALAGEHAAAVALYERAIAAEPGYAAVHNHYALSLTALGRLLLSEPAAVRWMLATDRSPWYPSMRLYRKQRDEPWRELVSRIAGRDSIRRR
jgi:hypothetical protein